MKKCFLFMVLALFIGVFAGCKGDEGKQGPAGATGATGATPEIWLGWAYVDGTTTNSTGQDSWETTVVLPFSTSASRVQVSIKSFNFFYTSGDHHISQQTVWVNSWEIIGTYTLKISGSVRFKDNLESPYKYQLYFSVIAFDYTYKVKGDQKIEVPVEVPVEAPLAKKEVE